MKKKLFASKIFLILWLNLANLSALYGAEISNIRFGKTESGGVRIVIEASSPIAFSAFSLNKPNRLVVDIANAKIRNDITNENDYLKFRYGNFRPQIMRIVFDIDYNFIVSRQFTLDGINEFPHRLVFDIDKSANPQVFARASASFAPFEVKQQEAVDTKITPPAVIDKPSKPVAKDKAKAPARNSAPNIHYPVIVLDAGHGGIDPGAKGKSGFFEKNITLEIVKKLKKSLQDSQKYKVVLTRDDDFFVPLRDRFRIAEEASGDIFISIHADSINNPNLNGASIYTLSEQASDSEAQKLAENENASDQYAAQVYVDAPSDIKRILLGLGQRNTKQESAILAKHLISQFQNNIELLNKPHRFAGFAVLKSPIIPSILIEAGFLSNQDMETKLRTEQYQMKLAKTIHAGIDEYFTRLENLNNSAKKPKP